MLLIIAVLGLTTADKENTELLFSRRDHCAFVVIAVVKPVIAVVKKDKL